MTFEKLLEMLVGEWSAPAIYHIGIPLIAAITLPMLAALLRSAHRWKRGLIVSECIGLAMSCAGIAVDYLSASKHVLLIRILNSGIVMDPWAPFLPALLFCLLAITISSAIRNTLVKRSAKLPAHSEATSGILSYEAKVPAQTGTVVVAWIMIGAATCLQVVGGITQVVLPETYIVPSALGIIVILLLCFLVSWWITLFGSSQVALLAMALSASQIVAWVVRITFPQITFPLFRN